jgi:hypothetical protein
MQEETTKGTDLNTSNMPMSEHPAYNEEYITANKPMCKISLGPLDCTD